MMIDGHLDEHKQQNATVKYRAHDPQSRKTSPGAISERKRGEERTRVDKCQKIVLLVDKEVNIVHQKH